MKKKNELQQQRDSIEQHDAKFVLCQQKANITVVLGFYFSQGGGWLWTLYFVYL